MTLRLKFSCVNPLQISGSCVNSASVMKLEYNKMEQLNFWIGYHRKFKINMISRLKYLSFHYYDGFHDCLGNYCDQIPLLISLTNYYRCMMTYLIDFDEFILAESKSTGLLLTFKGGEWGYPKVAIQDHLKLFKIGFNLHYFNKDINHYTGGILFHDSLNKQSPFFYNYLIIQIA